MSVKLDITAANNITRPSWESAMGLQKKMFKDSTRPESLEVSVCPMESDEVRESPAAPQFDPDQTEPITTSWAHPVDFMAKAVTETYVLQPDCGGASASMHVRSFSWIQSR